jgi:acetyl-CoA carboxylase biotin carboxylase subunit
MPMKDIRKVLIANRGEIAVRIIRTCKEMGLQTVAVYSEADRDALHVRLADEAHLLGPPQADESYLNINRLLEIALRTGAQAVHPGYGFLAESPTFVQACEEAGIIFVGPSSSTQALLADKVAARRLAQQVGVPIIPGTLSPLAPEQNWRDIAAKIGFPLLVKAAGGGGGKGMRLVQNETELEEALPAAMREARAYFGDERVYLEKWIQPARHVEVQVLADRYGNAVHLGERECSIQRRYQKLIEETPSPALHAELRERMARAALQLIRAAGYYNAGTVEFLLDVEGNFYFTEVNARLQVEHPVTEMVTGLDLVREQLLLAAGEPLAYRQEDIRPRGHAIECRIYAEDPYQGFVPSPGRIIALHEPGGPGVRVDGWVEPGTVVTPYYDALLSKLIVWGNTRSEAIARIRRALDEYQIVGVTTTIPYARFVMDSEAWQSGRYDTGFVSETWAQWTATRFDEPFVAALAAVVTMSSAPQTELFQPDTIGRVAVSPWKMAGRLGGLRDRWWR